MIQLDKDWRIEVDTYSFMLVQKLPFEKIDKETKQPTGEIGVKEEKWYYPTIKQCLQRFLKELGKQDSSIQEVINRIKNLEKVFDKLPSIYVKNGKLIQTK